MIKKTGQRTSAFTLIELLVVISIIGILIALSVFGLQGARQTSRDAKRKADLEQIRSGIEIYKADCNHYPIAATAGNPTSVLGASLVGDGSSPSCSSSNSYINQVPTDPTTPNLHYLYFSADGFSYQICASLEQAPATGPVSCDGSSDCGGRANSCNYKVINP